ncbi:MAG: 23S rRNA (pseudouridine(1915)-N(3))-methyltransferase RlmH [Tannerella sp.]|jgi:23S rRNA (pseudouridine1915-N3)-methyltransferase|nr:23S rRNA (pseudouridine(1915)-N(3))-methyltransferase RlmH [Tannerella sp.]
MKIILLVTGKSDGGFWNDATIEYTKRIKFYIPFDIEIIPDIKGIASMTEEQQRERQGASILKALSTTDYCILLDERGKEKSSIEFASFIGQRMTTSAKRTVFVVGGAYGFSEDVYQRADEKLSISRMTFSHQMIRAIFTEQLYRAMTILRGEKYHHE